MGNEHEIFRIDENDEEDSNARSYSFQFSEQNDDINDLSQHSGLTSSVALSEAAQNLIHDEGISSQDQE